jgi:hypothetical protein
MATEVVEYLKGNRSLVDTDYILQYNHTQKAEYSAKEQTLENFF